MHKTVLLSDLIRMEDQSGSSRLEDVSFNLKVFAGYCQGYIIFQEEGNLKVRVGVR